MSWKSKILFTSLTSFIPIVGIFFFHWSVFSILLSYWLENVVVGFIHLLKMNKATMNYPVDEKNKFIPGPLRPVTSVEKKFALFFFFIHYGIFLLGHLFFLRFFGFLAHDAVHFTWLILLSVLPLLIPYSREYSQEYVATKMYEKTPLVKLFFSPYRRIIILHLVIILGAIPILFIVPYWGQAGVILIILKIILEKKIQNL